MALGMGGSWTARHRTMPTVLLCLCLPLLPACLDCFDDGDLEATYRAGQASAREVNELEFARGYEEGHALTDLDGERDGDAAGYADGYHDGFYGPRGHLQGLDDGYGSGHTDGALDPNACTDGASQGYADGDHDGYYAGFDDTYAPSFDEGYGDGYDDGVDGCGFRAASGRPDAKDLDTCEARGYQRALDRSAFPRGFDAGKTDNSEYQAGFDGAYALAYSVGVSDGEREGYDEGFIDGYDIGFVDGYDLSFALCYDEAHLDGYDAGYVIGYDEGLAVGYDEGYQAGYDDGRAQCPE
jgi:hypothetical protein